MQKAVCVLLLVLALVFRADAQASQSNTQSNAPSIPSSVTPSNSNSNTPSWTNSNSNSLTPSNTNSISVSNSGSNSKSVSPSNSNSWTSSGSASNTYPQPPAPTNVVNKCANHIINICPSWTNAPGFVFRDTLVSYKVTGSAAAPTVLTVITTSLRIIGLQPATSYDFVIQNVLPNGVLSLPSATATFVTAAQDPKANKTLDIHNIVCTNTKNPTTLRSVITCTWAAAADPVVELRIKARCTSIIREPDEVRKHLFGARAQVTTVTLNMNRDVATCEVFIKARYARRPASRHHLTVVMGK